MDLKDQEDIKEVIEGCIKGQRKYQEILHKAFYGKMLVVCMRYAQNNAEAEDLLHDGFIKLYSKLSKYTYKGSFEGWIRRIIVNNSIDFIRKKKEFTVSFGSDNEHIINQRQENSDESYQLLESKQFKAHKIIKAIQELSPAYKAVFNMYVLEDMTHKEISEELGISVGTSKSNLSKAKLRIREILGSSMNDL